MTKRVIQFLAAVMTIIVWSGVASAQVITQKPGVPTGLPGSVQDKLTPTAPIVVPPDYTVGVEDILTITVWNDPKLSGDVMVRPDGMITLTYGEDIMALGLRIDELRKKVTERISKLYEEVPAIAIQLKQLNSRMVSITGAVNKQGRYPITGTMTIVDLIAVAGGLQEFADQKNILVISGTLKDKNGAPLTTKINFKDLSGNRNVARNLIELRPGDKVVVPGGL